MGFLRTPFSLGLSVARRGVGLGFDVAKVVAGLVLPGQRSADDTVRAMPTAPLRPDPRAHAGPAPSVTPPTPPPPPPGARPAPPPDEPPPPGLEGRYVGPEGGPPGDLPDEEAELVAEVGDPNEVGASVHVEGEPFPGYDALRAPEIVARLQDADESTRAIVRLYEQSNKQRKTVLDATER